jgi:hypothetical protein
MSVEKSDSDNSLILVNLIFDLLRPGPREPQFFLPVRDECVG